MISVILLAAGESKRMGQLKQLMPFGTSTILEQCLDNLLNSRVSEIVVVLGHGAKEIIESYQSSKNYELKFPAIFKQLLDKVSKYKSFVVVQVPDDTNEVFHKFLVKDNRRQKSQINPN